MIILLARFYSVNADRRQFDIDRNLTHVSMKSPQLKHYEINLKYFYFKTYPILTENAGKRIDVLKNFKRYRNRNRRR